MARRSFFLGGIILDRSRGSRRCVCVCVCVCVCACVFAECAVMPQILLN
jgi:hypothetical protein